MEIGEKKSLQRRKKEVGNVKFLVEPKEGGRGRTKYQGVHKKSGWGA